MNRDGWLPRGVGCRGLVRIAVLGAALWLTPASAPAWTGGAPAVRVLVEGEGVYRLTGSALAEAGLQLEGVSTDSLNLYYGGGTALDPEASPAISLALEPVEIALEGGEDGRLDPGDAILFYGQSTDRWERREAGWAHQRHPYTGVNVYWLCVGDARPTRRAEVGDGTPASGSQVRTAYTLRLHAESEVDPVWVASGNIRSGLDWYWQALHAGESHTFTAVTRSPVAGAARLRLAAFITSETEKEQVVRLRWNGVVAGQASMGGRGHHEVEFTAGSALAGVNELTVDLVSGDGILADWYEVELPHELAAERGGLLFDAPDTAGFYTYRVRGFGQQPRVFAVSSHQLRELVGTAYQAEDGAVTFSDSTAGSGTRYALLTSSRLRSPHRLDVTDPPGAPPVAGAEYVIITHADFVDQARRLATWRGADTRFGPPPTTAVIDVEDVYESHSGGLLDPTAIRNYLYDAATTWSPPPAFVVLFGDGSYDYRDNSGLGAGQWVPPYEDRESTYDDWYARLLDGDDLPDLAIGRLPVQTPGEAQVVVDKLTAYGREPEPGPWRGRVLLVADDTYNADLPQQAEPFFTADAETLATRFLPPGLDLEKLYLVEYPRDGRYKPQARDAFVQAVNRGAVLLTWVGHGNARVFAHEHIFVVSTDLASVANGSRLPFVYTAASQMGVFDDPLRDSVPEALLKWPGGGAIGMIAATRVGYHPSNMDLARRFHERLFRSGRAHVPVGLALLEAKRETAANRVNVQRYSLFGDPLTRLAIPELAIELQSPDTLRALGLVNVTGQVVNANGSRVTDFDGRVRLQVFDSASRRRVVEQGIEVEYERPGAPLFRGTAPVSGGRFTATFPVPKDITYRGIRGRVSAFAWAGSRAAFGSRENLVLAGTEAGVAADLQGPEIALGFSGQEFGDGDFIPASTVLEVTLRDGSGLNITGEVGHHIVLVLDGARREVTDLYEAGDDYREGRVRVAVSDLSEGRHRVALEAWDTHNNWSEVVIEAVVAASGRLALSEALFHPNPMAHEGHFSYLLSAPAERVEISVYSVAGRLVDRLAAGGRLGYNQRAWRPQPVLAGGTYIYRIVASGEASGGRAAASGAIQVVP